LIIPINPMYIPAASLGIFPVHPDLRRTLLSLGGSGFPFRILSGCGFHFYFTGIIAA